MISNHISHGNTGERFMMQQIVEMGFVVLFVHMVPGRKEEGSIPEYLVAADTLQGKCPSLPILGRILAFP